MMMIRKANERGHADHGWLNSYHTFSFADYHDPQWMGFRDLRVINDDTVAAGMGFGQHPHRDMEIISYVLDGELEHRDSMGNGRIIKPGEFQYLAAGSGVVHSEYNPSKRNPVHFLQIWIQPDKRGAKPAYGEKAYLDTTPGRLNLVASKSGREGSLRINQDADLWLARFRNGETVTHELKPKRHAWVHVAEGGVTLNGQPLNGGDAAAVSDESKLELAGQGKAQVLVFDLN
ncbi:MAG TPA: pirin family protein [Verrucomicrobiae bacterium]|nr:pirin family protein [Verrucomicrobiae bacterium]